MRQKFLIGRCLGLGWAGQQGEGQQKEGTHGWEAHQCIARSTLAYHQPFCPSTIFL